MDMTISSDSIALTLNPAGNAFSSRGLIISVGTNNPGGYRLFMSTTDGSTSLVKSDDSTKTIETLPSNGSTGYTTDTFVADRWGYKVGNANYFPFVSGSMINSSDTAVNNHTTNLTFGAKASYEKPSGTYNTTLGFSTLPKVTTTNMQDSNVAEVCTETPTVVTDSRDGQAYLIARLADGKCWMVQNLKLGKSTDSITLTAANSDVPSGGFTLNGKLSDGIFTYTTVDGVNYQNNSSQYYCTDDYGCYYNWYTATGGTGTTSVTSGNVNNSICPTGWTLPTGGSDGQLQTLTATYGGTDATAAGRLLVNPTTLTENEIQAPGLLLGGVYYSSGAYYVGGGGLYWSRTAYAAPRGYSLNLNASAINPTNDVYKYGGLAVRCLLKEGPQNISQVQTMQDLGKTDYKTEVLASMDPTRAYALRDERDNNYYNVAKLADSNVWMTTNLNLPGGTKLYSETSNVPSGYPSTGNGYYALPASSTSGFDDDDGAFVYNAPNKNNPAPTGSTTCTPANGSPCDSYYSWLAATAGGKDVSGSMVTGNGYNTAYSICPRGWRLPAVTNSNASPKTSPNWKTGDFYGLATAYGANLESQYYESSATFYNNVGPGTLPSFILAGHYYDSLFIGGGGAGVYWSSTSLSTTTADYLRIHSGSVYLANGYYRRDGYSVRCILQ